MDDNTPAMIIRSRSGAPRTVPLTREPITLGRAIGCDVVLRNDGGVSREHADVWLDDDGCVHVTDRGSKNGTRVDGGDFFRTATRRATSSIRIGEYDIELVGIQAPEACDQTEVRFAPEAPATVGDTRYFPSSKGLDFNQQRLSLLMSLTERIGGAFERKQLLEQAIDGCCEALGFERGLIALRTARGDPELPVTRNIERDESGAFKVSRTLINQALLHGQRAVVNNPATDLVENLSESLVRFPICSALCVPILHRDEILGVIYGDRITQASTYTPADVDFLAAIAQQVGVGLANLRLFQEQLRAQKIYHELNQARSIQRELLPSRPLSVGRVHVAGYNEPSSAVGGDYFDHFKLLDGTVGLTIADVTGHGLPAALVMANMQAAVRVVLTADIPLTEVGTRLNRLVCENTSTDVFITAVIGRVDPQTGILEFISAGHPGPILLRADDIEPIETDNALPFGIERDDRYEVHRIDLGQDVDAALFYTDGLTEAEDEAGHMCQLAPVLHALRAVRTRSPRNVLQATLDNVRGYVGRGNFGDDLTLLALQFER